MRFDTRCWLWKRDRWPDACQEKHACCRLRYWEARSSAGRAQVTSGTSCGVVCACWIGWTRKLLASRQVVRSWFCPRTWYAVTVLTARLRASSSISFSPIYSLSPRLRRLLFVGSVANALTWPCEDIYCYDSATATSTTTMSAHIDTTR